MLIRHLKDCPEFTAGDGCTLRELLHADKGRFAFRYSLAHAVVKPGQIGQDSEDVCAGDAIDIPPDAVQYISNIGIQDLVFLCIIDPAWRKADETV